MAPAMPFNKASLVRIVLGVMFFSKSSITARPEAFAIRFRLLDTAGAAPAPGRAIPRTSVSIHMEFAVPKWAQLPAVGRAFKGADNCYKWFFHIFLVHSGSIQQSSLTRTAKAVC